MKNTKEPEFRDFVRHKIAKDVTGTVISKFPVKFPGNIIKQFIDVRRIDDKLEYNTPAENWEVIRGYDEIE